MRSTTPKIATSGEMEELREKRREKKNPPHITDRNAGNAGTRVRRRCIAATYGDSVRVTSVLVMEWGRSEDDDWARTNTVSAEKGEGTNSVAMLLLLIMMRLLLMMQVIFWDSLPCKLCL